MLKKTKKFLTWSLNIGYPLIFIVFAVAFIGTVIWIYRPLPNYRCILYSDYQERVEYEILNEPFSKIETTKGIFKYLPIPPFYRKKRLEKGLEEYKKLKGEGKGIVPPEINPSHLFFIKNNIIINPTPDEMKKYPVLQLRGEVDSLGHFIFSEKEYISVVGLSEQIKMQILALIKSDEFTSIRHTSGTFDNRKINHPYLLSVAWRAFQE